VSDSFIWRGIVFTRSDGTTSGIVHWRDECDLWRVVDFSGASFGFGFSAEYNDDPDCCGESQASKEIALENCRAATMRMLLAQLKELESMPS
jgi:hypothetical protein